MGERIGNPFANRPDARLPQEDDWFERGLLSKPPVAAIEPAVCRAGDLFSEQERWPMESARSLPRTRTGNRENREERCRFQPFRDEG